MSDEVDKAIPDINSPEDIEVVMAEMVALVAQVKQLDDAEATAVTLFGNARKELQVAIEERRTVIGAYVARRRPSWRKRFGITATFGSGVITFRVIPKSVVTPKDTKPIIEALLNLRGGKRYLRVKYELDKDAVAQAGGDVLRLLRPLGLYVGAHENLSIKVEGEEKPTIVRHTRYPRPRRRR